MSAKRMLLGTETSRVWNHTLKKISRMETCFTSRYSNSCRQLRTTCFNCGQRLRTVMTVPGQGSRTDRATQVCACVVGVYATTSYMYVALGQTSEIRFARLYNLACIPKVSTKASSYKCTWVTRAEQLCTCVDYSVTWFLRVESKKGSWDVCSQETEKKTKKHAR